MRTGQIWVWWTVFYKELVDGIRDRRALVSALAFPLTTPILIAVMLNFMADPTDLVGDIELPVIGGEHAPLLIQALEKDGIKIIPAPKEPEQAVRLGEEEIVLRISSSYQESMEQSHPAEVELIIDESRLSSNKRRMRIETQIMTHGQMIGARRLLARGVDPRVARPISVTHVNQATPRTKAANILDMIGMFSVMAAFLCNMYVAIDATAGERERGSLEPLLLNPASRWSLVGGKWLATIAFGCTGEILMLLCTAIAMQQIPLEGLGMRLEFGFWEATQIFFVMFPLVLFAGAGQILLSSYAKSFKEAQTYLSTALFLPTLPGIFLMVNPMQAEGWMKVVPMLSHQFLSTTILRGDPLELDFVLLASAGALLCTAISLWVTVRLFRSESFFFRH